MVGLAACCRGGRRLLVVAVLLAFLLLGCGRSRERVGTRVLNLTEIATEGWSPLEGEMSPDGETLVFLATPNETPLGTTSVLVAGSKPRRIAPEDGDARGFAWMPDGKSVLVAYGDDLSSSNPNRYMVVDLNGNVERRIEPSWPHYGAFGLDVSVDGAKAYVAAQEPSSFDRPGDIWELNLADGAMTRVTDTSEDDESHPVILPDGRLLVTTGRLGAVRANGIAAVFDPRTGDTLDLSADGQVVRSGTLADDETVVFAGQEGGGFGRGLWIASVDTANAPELVASGSYSSPRASRDGSIVVTVGDDDGSFHLASTRLPDP